jgi:hypothetical protein
MLARTSILPCPALRGTIRNQAATSQRLQISGAARAYCNTDHFTASGVFDRFPIGNLILRICAVPL